MPTLRTLWNRVRVKVGAVNRTHAIVLAAQGQTVPNDESVSTLDRIAGELTKDRVASWVWQGRRREVLMDDMARRLFCLPMGRDGIPTERVLAHVWAPDRGRFERFISQAGDLRPMTPIELRVGNPGEYYNLVRTVNMACQLGLDGTVVLFASTVLHVFTP
jgi:hypothetical protein